MATINKIYSDIDFTFTKKPVTADVALSYDAQAVSRSIRNLLNTQNYDRLFNPDLGSQITGLLFENISPVVATTMETMIANIIKTYEPRAILKTVNVSSQPDQNAYNVSITFYIENATLPTTTTILLERNR
jgi:phage baseplate assembly protein W